MSASLSSFVRSPVSSICTSSTAGRSRCLRYSYLRQSRPLPRPVRAVVRPCAAVSSDSVIPATQDVLSGNGAPGSAQGISGSAPPLAVIPESSSPPDTYQKVVALGSSKADMPAWRILFMALVAGAYISFGALLLCSVGAACAGLAQSNVGLQKLVMGAFGLQYGLMMVLMCGAELFTGNTMIMAAAYWEGKASSRQVLRNWIISYIGNLLGCLAMVAVVQAAGIFAVSGGNAAMNIAVAKTSLSFGQAFVRGILANWLVCIAIWFATSASSVPGKVLGAYFPILTFVGIGLEHSVANMFFIPMGIALGAPVTWKAFFMANLLPVTLGNIVGGAVCMATTYALIFGSLGSPANKAKLAAA